MTPSVPQPTLELDGVRLRPLRAADVAPWHAYLSDPEVIAQTSYAVMTAADVASMQARVAQAYADGLGCKWAVALQADDRLIGTCGFNTWSREHRWAELAYELARPHWGRGFVGQAVEASLRWGFAQANFHRIHAFVMVGNARSEAVLTRAGFTREGCLRAYRVARGVPRDFSVFSLLQPEWARRQA
jgi:ribosomal-protein-alanine N-acetyltransferase